MKSNTKFNGFSEEVFKFFRDLEKNNNIEWFHKNKLRYQKYLIEPAKSFISEIAPFLNRLNPAIRSEPKFNETIMRLNKDMRFAKGEPYRTFLLIHFGRFKLDSEFYLYFDSRSFAMGMFINRKKGNNLYFGQNLLRYKKEIINICNKYKIDNNYSLSDLENNSQLIVKKFNSQNHLHFLENIDFILLERNKNIPDKILFSDEIILETIKMITQLYPLYCFAISPQPLKEIQHYEDNFGEILL
ncbi:DUF2461 family protein [Rosettibacter firmus]|uniref:DUF2461 family protein n=1 Tax=Rosettibacter firmus TaxID=3111522 RepID=UPI00336BD4E0